MGSEGPFCLELHWMFLLPVLGKNSLSEQNRKKVPAHALRCIYGAVTYTHTVGVLSCIQDVI